MTLTLPDIELREAVNEAVECSFDDCQNAAKWVATIILCGCLEPVCGPCFVEFKRVINTIRQSGIDYDWQCTLCGHSADFRDVTYRFDPI